MKYYWYLSILFLFSSFFANGQDIKFYRPNGDVSQNSITSIIQDDQGFLWFATKYGLNKYDGTGFQYFFQDNEKEISLNNSSIEYLYKDKKGKLWIIHTENGVSCFDTKNQNFIKLNPILEQGLKGYHLTTIYEDKDGDIWIGTEKNGVKVWNEKTQTLQNIFTGINKNHPNHITVITQDKLGKIWIGTWDNGISLYHKEKKIFSSINSQNTPELRSNRIREFHKGKKKNLWVGTDKGLFQIKNFGENDLVYTIPKTVKEQLSNFIILSIVEDSNERLWIGTENNGLYLYDFKTNDLQEFKYNPDNKFSLQNNSIWSIYEDAQEIIWIGLFKNGILKVDPFERKFNHISDGQHSEIHLNYGLISSFSEDQDGNLWVGTDGGGLNYINRNEKKLDVKNFNPKNSNLKSNEIVCLLHDDKNQLWIGTWGEGVFVKDYNNKFTSFTHDPNNPNSLSSNNIMSMIKDHNQNIWMANHRVGLDLFLTKENKFINFLPSFDNNSITSDKCIVLAQDKNHNYWLGTEGSGVDRFRLNEKNEIIELENFHFSNDDKTGISDNFINYIFVDSKNRIWLATNNGINRLDHPDSKDFIKISTEQGLPSKVIYGIQEETPEKFWVSTNAGLASIDLTTNEIQTYDIEDGLQAREFNRSACYKAKDNTLMFGGINGFNYFKPNEISKNLKVPPIFITNFEVKKENIDDATKAKLKEQLATKKIKLKSNENNIVINFAALNYSQPTKNQYSYQLENYDSNWRNSKNINSASYTNLPPGDYVFKVKASNNDQIWNEESATLTITVSPPWYKSWWAILLYCFLGGLIVYGIFRNLLLRERLKHDLLLKQNESVRMKELNNMRSQFFANMTHEFKTPLTLIISPLKMMQKKLEKIENKNQVNVMLRNAERLHRLINQMLDLSKIESGLAELKTSKYDIVRFSENMASNFIPYSEEQSISFKIDIPETSIPIYFEKDKMEKVFINLLSNAFKYTSKEDKITVQLSSNEKYAIISFIDTGIGIPSDKLHLIFDRFYQVKNSNTHIGSGIGLSLTKQLVELHGGKIEVKSQQGSGTRFDVFLLKGASHLAPKQIISDAATHRLSEDSIIELKDFEVATDQDFYQKGKDENELPLILIVEDNPDLRSFTKTCLQGNYRVIEAEDGEQGFELAKSKIPDLIITDLMMPKMNGFELCQKLRNNEKTSHIFIIMLTVKSSEESIQMGFEFGVNHYLTKPFNPKILNLRIKNSLDSRDTYKMQMTQGLVANNISTGVKKASKDEIFIEKILKIVEANLNDSNFHVEDLCREVGFSKSQLYRKLKSIVGQSANEFIRTVRLKEAAKLLQEENMNISEVTYKVGFNDLQYFRGCFKKQYGMNPSEYVQQLKN